MVTLADASPTTDDTPTRRTGGLVALHTCSIFVALASFALLVAEQDTLRNLGKSDASIGLLLVTRWSPMLVWLAAAGAMAWYVIRHRDHLAHAGRWTHRWLAVGGAVSVLGPAWWMVYHTVLYFIIGPHA